MPAPAGHPLPESKQQGQAALGRLLPIPRARQPALQLMQGQSRLSSASLPCRSFSYPSVLQKTYPFTPLCLGPPKSLAPFLLEGEQDPLREGSGNRCCWEPG